MRAPFAAAPLLATLLAAGAPTVLLGLVLAVTTREPPRTGLTAAPDWKAVSARFGRDWRLYGGLFFGTGVAGVVSFVGLVVPHLVRPLTDRRPSSLLLPSALAGALLVLVADCLCRILPLVTELRLGIALSLLGAPFFLVLLLRMRRGLV